MRIPWPTIERANSNQNSFSWRFFEGEYINYHIVQQISCQANSFYHSLHHQMKMTSNLQFFASSPLSTRRGVWCSIWLRMRKKNFRVKSRREKSCRFVNSLFSKMNSLDWILISYHMFYCPVTYGIVAIAGLNSGSKSFGPKWNNLNWS